MTGALDQQDDASTPLSAEEKEGLIPAYITMRRELNEAEQANVANAENWAFRRKRDVLSEDFLNRLHKRMFGDVWKWAGEFRTTGKNIGVPRHLIGTELRYLLDDCRYQIEHETYLPDEIAARFHHRLVQIHPYPNGNGRHGRMATDLLVVALGQKRFTWGRANLVDQGGVRNRYVAALRAADGHEMEQLMAFVRS